MKTDRTTGAEHSWKREEREKEQENRSPIKKQILLIGEKSEREVSSAGVLNTSWDCKSQSRISLLCEVGKQGKTRDKQSPPA